MATPIQIDPVSIYDDTLLSTLLGVSAQTLARARRGGDLRYTRKGQRILYLGAWVLAWLGNEGAGQGKVVAHVR
jgi:hypothetical protein